jgi:hypothetical protein
MELSGVGASERELDFVSDERAERFSSLGAADVTPDKSKVRQSLMSSGSWNPERDPFLPTVFLLSAIPIFGIQRKKNFALLCSFQQRAERELGLLQTRAKWGGVVAFVASKNGE